MKLHPALLLLPLLAACEDVKEDEHDDHHGHNHGLITALVLNFDDGAGEAFTYSWEDPEGDGQDPMVDDIVLSAGTTYDLSMQVLNQLEDPVEDVTLEIAGLADEHQVFFTGAGVVGPASNSSDAIAEHEYMDSDSTGLPLGLDNLLTTFDPGTGDMTVTLRHLPPENGNATKVAGLEDSVAAEGFSAIGGDNDIQVTFTVTSN